MTRLSAAQRDCVHHWVIETPNGHTSEGVCKLCDLDRQGFVNGHDFYKASENVHSVPTFSDRAIRTQNGRVATPEVTE